MSDLLKDMFNKKSLGEVAAAIKAVYEPFETDEFLKTTMDETWPDLELKARGRKITTSLGQYLPQDYKAALAILEKAVSNCPAAYFFPDFVEVYGQDEENWDLSVGALARNTVYWSSEMAVRPFIINHEGHMMAQMYLWSKDENEHIRRLSSEGCRPALPWAMALPKYKKDPTPVLPILEQLKADPSHYVRNSVANNLNDISKTNPDLVVKIAKEWYGENEDTNWIVKHGCRTLLKKGNRDVLAIFGYDDVASAEVSDFVLAGPTVKIGEDMTFSFTISTKKAAKVRLEYGIDYVKSTGKQSRKIFQISESEFKENQEKNYVRKHSFEDVSTRKHYVGAHRVTLIVNGVEQGTLEFEVTL